MCHPTRTLADGHRGAALCASAAGPSARGTKPLYISRVPEWDLRAVDKSCNGPPHGLQSLGGHSMQRPPGQRRAASAMVRVPRERARCLNMSTTMATARRVTWWNQKIAVRSLQEQKTSPHDHCGISPSAPPIDVPRSNPEDLIGAAFFDAGGSVCRWVCFRCFNFSTQSEASAELPSCM
jgi:hypothetical protein